jgi:hypothetical protein
MIPTPSKLLAIALAASVVLGAIATTVAYYVGRKIGDTQGYARCTDENAKALAEQQKRDRILSAEIIEAKAARERAEEALSNNVRVEIRNVPVTTGCGPVVNNTIDKLRPKSNPK